MSDNESDEDDSVMLPALQVCSTVLGFRRLKSTKEDQFYHLDWTDVMKDIIIALFPIQEGKYRSMDHPLPYLKSTALVKQWRMIGGNEQQNVIDRLEEEEERVRKAQATSSARERRSNRRSGDDDLLRAPPEGITTRKKSRLEHQVEEDDDNISDNPPPLERHETAIDDEVASEVPLLTFQQCHGITKATINASRIDDKDKVLAGYANVVGNVLRSTAHYVSKNNAEWPFGHDIAGYLLKHNGKDGDPHNWVCKRVEEDEKMVRFSSAHKACTGVVKSGTGLCAACMSNRYSFFRKCRVEVDKHEKALNDPTLAGRLDLLKYASPSILMRGI